MTTKFLTILISLAVSFSTAAEPSLSSIETIQNEIRELLSVAEGLNGSGIAQCSSGELCLAIYAETIEAEAAMRVLFPEGSRYKGVEIKIEFIGTVGISSSVVELLNSSENGDDFCEDDCESICDLDPWFCTVCTRMCNID